MPNTASDNLINDDLYRQIILDHYSRPRCNHRLEHPTCSVEGTNPSCGDEIELGATTTPKRLKRPKGSILGS